MLTLILFTLLLLGLIFVVSEFFRVYNNGCSRYHTIWSLFIHFLLNRVVLLLGNKARRQLERDTKNFPQVQEEFLLNILKKNSETTYGREFNFKLMKTRQDFVKSHPVTKYNHYKNFIGKYSLGI